MPEVPRFPYMQYTQDRQSPVYFCLLQMQGFQTVNFAESQQPLCKIPVESGYL